MAIGARDVPITREQVHGWLADYDGEIGPTKKMKKYIEGKVKELELPDRMVDVSLRDDFDGPEVDVVDIIMEDLGSYV
jgi:hypothetical protein